MMTDAKKIIGLTGNIATGKSVVRRMLANSGALGIDADDISHRVLYPGAPAYQPVIDAFGGHILTSQGTISRRKVGEIVFNDKRKLSNLEKLIHPWVTKAIEKRIQMTHTTFIVIEAIKLFESELRELCDEIWVSHASQSHQLKRLQQSRHMSHEQAMERISAQTPQSEKVANADVVINTEGSFEDTWIDVQNALNRLNDTIQVDNNPSQQNINRSKGLYIGSARQLRNEEWMNQWKDLTSLSSQEIYEELGMQMILPLIQDQQCKSLIVWENCDFTATLSALFPEFLDEAYASTVFNAFQHHAHIHQCEVLLLPNNFTTIFDLCPEDFGYTMQLPSEFSYPSWEAAARKQAQDDQTKIWVKIIAKPIETEDHLIF